MNLFLGIDTSAYTTSLALVSGEGDIVADKRIVLDVAPGKRGLRQSEAHFAHVRNLPSLFESCCADLAPGDIGAVAVSDRPRPLEKSYMPVFLAGSAAARTAAALLNVPLYTFSHQEGHVEAALYGIVMKAQRFLAVHFSGGTSEILAVEENGFRYNIEIISATADISAGQLVDRVGVEMGLPFPAGPAMEKLALDSGEGLALPASFQGERFSFSGAETAARRLLLEGVPREQVAFMVFRCIANTLEKGLRFAVEKTGLRDVVMAGGVMANVRIRERLVSRLAGTGIRFHWARPELSTDNAVGIALLGRKSHFARKEGNY